MKSFFRINLPTAALGAVLCLTAGSLLADETTDAARTPTYPVVHTSTGIFKNTNGESGTFEDTVTLNSADSKSEVVIFTRTKDQATRTETRTITKNGDGTRTVDYRATEYNSTDAFASHKTLTKEKDGQFSGVGTYTTAEGVSGTLTTLESKAETVDVISAVYRTAEGAITNDLRLEDSEPSFRVIKTVHLAPTGTVTTSVYTRYVTGHGK